MSDQSKPWWQSKTILGALAVLIVLVLREAFPDLKEDDVLNILTLVSQAAASVLAIFGRVKADKKIA